MPGSSAGAQSTVTRWPLSGLSATANDSVAVSPLSPSRTLGEPIDSDGAPSSSSIVPVPVAVPIVALVAFESSRTTVSSGSSRSSPVTVTATVALVSPGSKVRVAAVRAS